MHTSTSLEHMGYKRIVQVIVGLAGVLYYLTGIALLFAPGWFFLHIGRFPPFNQHYEGDLGSFLLALGIGLLVAAFNPVKHIWVIRIAAIGSLLHVGNHVYDALIGSATVSEWLGEIVPLFVLALALMVISWGYREKP